MEEECLPKNVAEWIRFPFELYCPFLVLGNYWGKHKCLRPAPHPVMWSGSRQCAAGTSPPWYVPGEEPTLEEWLNLAPQSLGARIYIVHEKDYIWSKQSISVTNSVWMSLGWLQYYNIWIYFLSVTTRNSTFNTKCPCFVSIVSLGSCIIQQW